MNLSGGNGGPVATLPTMVISTAPAWGGPWTFQDTAIFRSVRMFSASEDVDSHEFATPYGRVLSPYTGFSIRKALNLENSWVALDVLDPSGSAVTAFVGQILGEDRRVMGSDPDGGGDATFRPKGMQAWTGYGGAMILQRTRVSRSFWVSPPQGHGSQSAGVAEEKWTPGFNVRDPHNLLRGNRSDAAAADDASSFVFGGSSLWTRRQAVDYLFKRFLAKNGGPTWTLGGQLDALSGDLGLLEIGVTDTLDHVLRKILAHKVGLEFGVRPTFDGSGAPTGYEIHVFTLTATPVSFGGATIPANPSTVAFSTLDMDAVEDLRVGSDRTHTVSRIRLLGERVIVCGSLLGPKLAGDSSTDILNVTSASLAGKWSAELETAYKAGSPSADVRVESQHDAARKDVKFESVYRLYGLPTGFVRPAGWSPLFDGSGTLLGGQEQYQDFERETLSFLPLRKGYDYSTNPPTNLNPAAEATPDFGDPFLVARDRKAEIATGSGTTSAIWALGEHLHLGHRVLKKDLGLLVECTPNHRLAVGRAVFDGTEAGTARSEHLTDPANDGEGHGVDALSLGFTIAWKTDRRFELEYVVDAASDDGTVMEIAVPQAQLWVLAAGTIVGVLDGKVQTAPQTIVLRNDADLYAQDMAGLIARYAYPRKRADLTFHGWRPWLSLLGSVLTTVEEGGQSHGINAPITCVELHGGENNSSPRTVVRAGFLQ